MRDDLATAIARVEGREVRGARGAASPERDSRRREAGETPQASPSAGAASPRSTDLAFQVDADAHRIVVHVVERETGTVVRSFPLVLPGVGTTTTQETPRGALVDAKA